MPRLPLARTCRPQRFADVLGQQVPVRALGAAAVSGDIASAYIFSGTRGIGKTTLARLFAKTLNCQAGPAADCCDTCSSCREIAEGRALDVLELDAATHTGIDDIRELREAAQYPPGRDRYRVFILDEAHQLSQSAWNGLLKILEEPPPWCVFLFCTTEPHKIPATIESRALHFSFRSPTPAQIREHLARVATNEQIPVDDDALDLLVQAADGSVRDGLSALDQVRALAGGPITRDAVRAALGLVPGEAVGTYVAALGSGDAAGALAVVATLDEEGQDLRSFTGDVLERVRRLALVRAAGAAAVPGGEALAPAAQAFALEQLVFLGRVLDETESRLRQGGAQRALLDLATIRMTRMAGLTPLAELVDRLGADGPGPGPGAGRPGGGPGGGGVRDAAPRSPQRPVHAAPPRPSRADAPARAAAPTAGPTVGSADDADPWDSGEASAATPAPAAPVAIPAASAAPAPPPTGGTLLGRLVDTLAEIRPAAAAYLRNVDAAEVTDAGALRLRLPPGREMYTAQLTKPATQDALLEAAGRVLGRPVAALEVSVAENRPGPRAAAEVPGAPGAGGNGFGNGPGGNGQGGNGHAGPGNGYAGGPAAAAPTPRAARREALDRARKDPLVRALFDQFGASFLDGQLLAAPGIQDDVPPRPPFDAQEE